MSDPLPRLSDLTPDELEVLALQHVDSAFLEVDAACRLVREEYHPVRLIERHPFIAAGLAAAAAFMLGRRLSAKPAASSAEKAPGLLDSVLSGVAGAAGRMLPELLASWMAQRREPD